MTKRPTIAFMDDATGDFLFFTTQKELKGAKWSLRPGALVRIAGKVWQIVRICPTMRRASWRFDVVEVNVDDLLAAVERWSAMDGGERE